MNCDLDSEWPQKKKDFRIIATQFYFLSYQYFVAFVENGKSFSPDAAVHLDVCRTAQVLHR